MTNESLVVLFSHWSVAFGVPALVSTQCMEAPRGIESLVESLVEPKHFQSLIFSH